MSNFLKSDYKRQSSISLPDISKTKALEDPDMMDSFLFEQTTSENAVDEELANIQQIVDKVKSRTDVKEHYMTLQEMIDYEKKDSYDEGVEIGRSEGIELGRSEGIELGVQAIITTYKTQHLDCSRLSDSLATQFQLTKEKADEYINLYW